MASSLQHKVLLRNSAIMWSCLEEQRDVSPSSVLVYKARINHLLIPTSVGAAKPEREKAACTKYYLHIQKCVATTKSQITVLNNNKFMYIWYKHIFGIDYNNLHLS